MEGCRPEAAAFHWPGWSGAGVPTTDRRGCGTSGRGVRRRWESVWGQSRLALDDVIGYTAQWSWSLHVLIGPGWLRRQLERKRRKGTWPAHMPARSGPRRPLGSGTRDAHVSPHRYPRAAVVRQSTRVYQSVNASKMPSARPHGPPTRSDAPSHPVHVTPRHSISVARRWRRDGVGPSPTGREQAEMPSNLRSVAVRVGRDKHQSVGIGSAAPAVRVSVHCGGYGCRSACSWYANRPNKATPTGR